MIDRAPTNQELALAAELALARERIAELEHAKENLHGHIRRLEELNSRLERKLVGLR